MMILLGWLMLGVQIGGAPKAASVPLTISISALKSEVSYGSQIAFNIELVNRTNHMIDCSEDWSDSVNLTYPFKIFNMSGKKILPHFGPMSEGSSRHCTLDPGATKRWAGSVIPTEYPEIVPGEYRIRVSAANPDNPSGERLYSNEAD